MYTFHRTSGGGEVLRNEAPLHRFTPKYSQGRQRKKKKDSHKKCVTPKNVPFHKKKKKKVQKTFFQHKHPFVDSSIDPQRVLHVGVL